GFEVVNNDENVIHPFKRHIVPSLASDQSQPSAPPSALPPLPPHPVRRGRQGRGFYRKPSPTLPPPAPHPQHWRDGEEQEEPEGHESHVVRGVSVKKAGTGRSRPCILGSRSVAAEAPWQTNRLGWNGTGTSGDANRPHTASNLVIDRRRKQARWTWHDGPALNNIANEIT